jgi:hypothetical protein
VCLIRPREGELLSHYLFIIICVTHILICNRCWSSEVNNPCPGALEGVPASRGYTGGFASALMLKDLGMLERMCYLF